MRKGWSGMVLVAATLFVSVAAAVSDGHAMLEQARAEHADSAVDAALHVPSPDWRDQVVYFLMIDRFDNGDPRNDDQHAGEYDAADGAKFSGGDSAGVTRRLDYVAGLGATAVWITPPVANQWWNPRVSYGGYHGYWAEDFSAVDAHFGTVEDYRQLSRGLHGRGMWLIQDIVLNHTGDYFSYPPGHDPAQPARDVVFTADSTGRTAPSRWPFSQNDPRDTEQRDRAIYHWTADITDYDDPRQLQDNQLAGLDDLDSANPVVRRALRRAYGDWVESVGVDAFRLDTAFYVAPADIRDFMFADDAQAPGMRKRAAATGRDGFFVFGEGFGIDRPFEDVQERRIEDYVRDDAGRPVLPGMLNFPLYGSLLEVFARGRPTAELGYRIRSLMRVHTDPHRMPSFVDNHDVDRFLAGGSEAALKQALLAIMTLPGIPVIYYGTEQGFTEPRAAMFAGGFGSGGQDHFDNAAPLYRYLKGAIALRRGQRVLSRGTPTVLADSAASAGLLAYRVTRDASDGARANALVMFNTADHAVLADAVDTGLAPGTRLRGVFAIDGLADDMVVGGDGRVTLPLAARAGLVWLASEQTGTAVQTSSRQATNGISMDDLGDATFSGDVIVKGRAPAAASLRIVVDGDLASATVASADDHGRWRATLPTAGMLDSAVVHRVVAWQLQSNAVSVASMFRVARPWRLVADVADPRDDDHGRSGGYTYPDAPAWRDRHPADLRGTQVSISGNSLRIRLRMRDLQSSWAPSNGFDHVAFTVFVELPGVAGGATVMPLQNAALPDGMRWHYRLRATGWSSVWTTADGASATSEGGVRSPAPQLAVDRKGLTVVVTMPASALGNPSTLDDARVYVSTWDVDGAARALLPEATASAFGGGHGARDPLVMDDTAVIRLASPTPTPTPTLSLSH